MRRWVYIKELNDDYNRQFVEKIGKRQRYRRESVRAGAAARIGLQEA